MMRIIAALIALALAMLVLRIPLCSHAQGAEPPTPGDSIYQLRLSLQTQDDRSVALDVYRGHPVLITMFYGSCPYACPTLIHTMQRVDARLDAANRSRLRGLLVSIDPDHDTPAALKDVAARYGADLSRWTFTTTTKDSVRQLAAVLGIQYRELEGGGFNHSTIITLLDADGRILAHTARMTGADEDFDRAVREATR